MWRQLFLPRFVKNQASAWVFLDLFTSVMKTKWKKFSFFFLLMLYVKQKTHSNISAIQIKSKQIPPPPPTHFSCWGRKPRNEKPRKYTTVNSWSRGQLDIKKIREIFTCFSVTSSSRDLIVISISFFMVSCKYYIFNNYERVFQNTLVLALQRSTLLKKGDRLQSHLSSFILHPSSHLSSYKRKSLTLRQSLLNFLLYEENSFLYFFISVFWAKKTLR